MEEEKKDYDFYKLICKTNENIYYIGSSSNMENRVRTHKGATNRLTHRNYNQKTYKIIRANGGFDNFKFINLGNIKNVTEREAHHTEQALINLFEPNMNSKNSYLTDEERKEYRKEFRKNHKEESKEYRENNKEEITAKMKIYRENNKEKIKEYRENNKEKLAEYKKEYCEKNKEHIAEKMKKYRENNKEDIKLKRSEMITCECGSTVRKIQLAKHKRTKKHIDLMNN
jgi:hypothetical protein